MPAGRQPPRRAGRPRATLKGHDRAVHEFVNHLLGLVDRADVTVAIIAAACECSRSTVSKRLNGEVLPDWPFVATVVRVCTPAEKREARLAEMHRRWERADHEAGRVLAADTPEPSGTEMYTRLVESQAQTINAQRQLVIVHDDLARAKEQLVESVRAEARTSQMVYVLHVVISRLNDVIVRLTAERAQYLSEAAHRGEAKRIGAQMSTAKQDRQRAESQLRQARAEKKRAAALAESAQERIDQLELELRGAPASTSPAVPAGGARDELEPPTPAADDVLLDTGRGLDRMQRLLDDQGEELDRLDVSLVSESSRPRDGVALARRLRQLRETNWPGTRITQTRLAEVLGVSVPLVASWESLTKPAAPPDRRLEAYSMFFAPTRPFVGRNGESPRLPNISTFTDDERQRREELLSELRLLRGVTAPPVTPPRFWRFPDERDIVMVLNIRAPVENRGQDATLELYGHLRALNPVANVAIRTADELTPDDYTANLVVLGNSEGLGFSSLVPNPTVAPVLVGDADDAIGYEVTKADGTRTRYQPRFRVSDGETKMLTDVYYLCRTPNPFNTRRSLSIVAATTELGLFAAVRALTDPRFLDRNEHYIDTLHAGAPVVGILGEAQMLAGQVLTPDWTHVENVLYRWTGDHDVT